MIALNSENKENPISYGEAGIVEAAGRMRPEVSVSTGRDRNDGNMDLNASSLPDYQSASVHEENSRKIATNSESISIELNTDLVTSVLGTQLGVGGPKEEEEREEREGNRDEGGRGENTRDQLYEELPRA